MRSSTAAPIRISQSPYYTPPSYKRPTMDTPTMTSRPRASRDLYEHLRAFPWDVSCLTYLRCRHDIFPEVFNGKAATTKMVEYLVELRFLTTALKGWSEVVLGSSPHTHHHLSPLDTRFVGLSIAHAYAELPEVFKELAAIRERTYSGVVKKYCQEVEMGLAQTWADAEVRALVEGVRKQMVVDGRMTGEMEWE